MPLWEQKRCSLLRAFQTQRDFSFAQSQRQCCGDGPRAAVLDPMGSRSGAMQAIENNSVIIYSPLWKVR